MNKLYIIIRTDMASMTTGRIAAQASHAANQFVGEAELLLEGDRDYYSYEQACLEPRFIEWRNQTNSFFGTVNVMNGGSEKDIQLFLDGLKMQEYFSAAVIDPEYPLQDGKTVHILKDVMTCAYVFPIHDNAFSPPLESLDRL